MITTTTNDNNTNNMLIPLLCIVIRTSRIQAGDMLVGVYGCAIRENYEEAFRLLDQPSSGIRLKVGRPDITSSVFSVKGGREVRTRVCVCVYV